MLPSRQRKDIPKLPDNDPYRFGAPSLRNHNANYYRELAGYEAVTRLCREVRITVRNAGQTSASNVRVELVIPTDLGMLPIVALPQRPEQKEWPGSKILPARRMNRRDPGEVDIDENKDRYRIEIDCRDMQPGRRVWSDTFYLGAAQSGDYQILGEVFADNLPVPQQFTLTVAAEVEHTTLTLDELCAD